GWIMTTIGGFLVQPPAISQREEPVWFFFGQFVVAILVGLAILAPKKVWRAEWYCLAAFLLLLVTVVLVISYYSLRNAWTGSYSGQRVVIGDEYTTQAAAFVAKEKERGIVPTTEDLLMNYGGEVERIRTMTSITRAGAKLAFTYISCVIFCTLCLASVIE